MKTLSITPCSIMGKRQLSKQSLTFLSNEMLHCQLSEAPITPNE